tara:strand:+ start:29967 stop:32042 length:2076 start_codon:yes stop_codon:yes gene_type:complete
VEYHLFFYPLKFQEYLVYKLINILSLAYSYFMIFFRNIIYLLFVLFLLTGCKSGNNTGDPEVFQLLTVKADNTTLTVDQVSVIAIDAVFSIRFSNPVDTTTAKASFELKQSTEEGSIPLAISFEENGSIVKVKPEDLLIRNTTYEFSILENLKSREGASFLGISYTFETENGEISLVSATVNDKSLSRFSAAREIAYNDITFEITFSEALNEENYESYFSLSPSATTSYLLSNDGKTVTISNEESFDYYRFYTLRIDDELTAANGFEFDGYETVIQTGLDSTLKFPQISDEELLTKVQEQTFKYFWDFAHPVSGLARERNTSGETVTIGGSGFGLQSIIVGIHRGFITRTEGIERLAKVIDFLGNADRFHGVWPHWMNGSTGNVIPFSTKDNGADLVETAFMAQALITVREYLDANIPNESNLIDEINTLLNGIEWNWFTKNGENVLYWHWSPNFNWEMNLPIRGYNEALIVYLLAASSQNYAINNDVYNIGWARSGGIQNGNTFYGITLPLGYDFGGPLFFAHYSFMGLDPRNLSDTYTNYFTQNRNHTLINREHSVVNPNNFVGYSAQSWGLTASDEPGGYSAHEPTRDNGTLTPTAALSSMPYTPTESMEALRHFYYKLGDKLWGEYGFYDAFNPTESWWANSFLAIDQGPIIVMIENHRSGLIWDLFMSAPEIQTAIDTLGFTISNQ